MQSKNTLNNKNILITGVAGTIGQALIKELLDSNKYQVGRIIGIDNNESELFFVEQAFQKYSNSNFYLVDIKDVFALDAIMKDIQIVIHCAANKHVILCEKSPSQAVANNIEGTINLLASVKKNNVEKFIFTSSDKAVNPTNVMGTSKLMGERLVTASNLEYMNHHGTIFSSTRFGNVLGSNGSVVPIFKNQIKSGNNLTLTNPEMTRFFMSKQQAVDLILQSCEMAKGGEVFVTKMPVIKIQELAEVMIEYYSSQGHLRVEIDIIGSKPGEKLYEELMSDEESFRSVELSDYFVVLPAFKSIYNSLNYDFDTLQTNKVSSPYNSATEAVISKVEILDFLKENDLL